MFRTQGILITALTLVFTSSSWAGLEQTLKQAETLFADREDAAKVTEAIKLADEVIKDSKDDELTYSAYLMKSKALYWQGKRATKNSDKITIHDAGHQAAEEAVKLFEDYAEAYYWSAINMGRWAEANGVVTSLFKKGQMFDTLEKILDRDTRDFEAGDSYEGYGIYRTRGRLYYKLPSWAGGSRTKALKDLKTAYTKAKDYALNAIYYAEVLFAGDAVEKAEARKILDELLKKDPKTLNAGRVQETVREFETATQLRKEFGN